jgi:hypothetical protein
MKMLNKNFIEIDNVVVSLNWLNKMSDYRFYIANNELYYALDTVFDDLFFMKATKQDVINILYKAQIDREEDEIVLNYMNSSEGQVLFS